MLATNRSVEIPLRGAPFTIEWRVPGLEVWAVLTDAWSLPVARLIVEDARHSGVTLRIRNERGRIVKTSI